MNGHGAISSKRVLSMSTSHSSRCRAGLEHDERCLLGRPRGSLDDGPVRHDDAVPGELRHVVVEAEPLVVDHVTLGAAGPAVEPGHVHPAQVDVPDRHAVQDRRRDVAERDGRPQAVGDGEAADRCRVDLLVEAGPEIGVGVVAAPDPVPDAPPHHPGDVAIGVAHLGGLGTGEEALGLAQDA